MKKITIIGGGIIGLTTAIFLRKSGLEVEVLDRFDFKTNCSTRNAGLLVPSHFVPLAAPGVVMQAVKWAFNPYSPFALKLNPSMIGWGLKFLGSSNQQHVQKSYRPLYDLNIRSRVIYEELAAELDFPLKATGLSLIFKTPSSEADELKHIPMAEELGVRVDHLKGNELKELSIDGSLDAHGALHYHSDASIYPVKYVENLIAWLISNGVSLHGGVNVNSFRIKNNKIEAALTNKGDFTANEFILATGASSPRLFRALGLKIPIQPGKGYSFEYPKKFPLKYPAILVDGRVAISIFEDSARISGVMDIGNKSLSVDMKRIKGLVDSVNSYFPGMNLEVPAKEEIWAGFRPNSADGLPYIGPVKKYTNLLIGTGHSMMGVSMAAITGKILNDLIVKAKSDIEMKSFSPDRFQ